MNQRLGIVILHHRVDPVTEYHVHRVRHFNPDATVVTVSAGEVLPRGYSIAATPELQRLHSWRPAESADRLLCSWFLQREEVCNRWWVIEWDVFVAVSVFDYYRPVWDYPFVAPSVRLRNREPEWDWFKYGLREIPAPYKPFIMGAVPFFYLVSEAALTATCTTLIDEPIAVGNSELRFATAANRRGFAPCGFSPPNDQVTWIPWSRLPTNPTIVHPVKQRFDNED